MRYTIHRVATWENVIRRKGVSSGLPIRHDEWSRNMLVHRLIAYDLQTEEMVVELPIKESLLPTLRVMAGIPATDPQAIGSYPLTPSVIRDIAEDVDMDPDSASLFDWFLEAFEVESEYA